MDAGFKFEELGSNRSCSVRYTGVTLVPFLIADVLQLALFPDPDRVTNNGVRRVRLVLKRITGSGIH
jgi:hypothetical protein